jgi:hypothetical protein
VGSARFTSDIPDDIISEMGRHIGPDAMEGSLPKLLLADPSEMFNWGTVGIRWVAADGNSYGEVLYLPPLVYQFLKGQIKPEYDLEGG